MKRNLRTALVLIGMAVAACGGDDDAQQPGGGAGGVGGAAGASGAAGVGGAAGTAGTAGGGGASGNAGSAGKAGGGGASGNAGSAGKAGGGGASGNAGSAGSGGVAGTAGSGGANTDVVGKVVDGLLLPIANVPVVIDGAVVATSSTGEFSIPNVAGTYDVVVSAQATHTTWVFQGITRRDPTLQLQTSPTAHQATVSGTLVGSSFGVDVRRSVVFASPEGRCRDNIAGLAKAEFSCDLLWDGDATTSGNVHAIQWAAGADDVATSFSRYGTSPLSVTSGATASASITMTDIDDAEVSGHIIPPAGLSSTATAIRVVLDDSAEMDFPSIAPAGDMSFSHKVPIIPNATITLVGGATEPHEAIAWAIKTGVAPGATSVEIAIPDPPVLWFPVNSATGVTNATEFSWRPFAGGIHVLSVSPSESSSTAPRIAVVTSSNQTTIPDLSALGITLPSGVSYHWMVAGLAPFADMDAATGPAGCMTPLLAATKAHPVLKHDASVGAGGPRVFTPQ